jgi:nitrite reductase (NO-forming)
MRSFRVIALLAISLVVVLTTGCGGDDGGGTTTSATTTGTTSTGTTEAAAGASVTMDEYSFDPGDVTVKQGGTIEVKNDGAIAHNLTIEQGPDPKTKSKKLAGTPTFTPGKTEKLKVDLKPGKYAMACTVAGHRQLGMTGTVTVK